MDNHTDHTASQIAFVFDNVGNYQQLLGAFRPGVEVVVLDASQDGLAQMAAVLAGRSGIAALHVIGHGAKGALDLGAIRLDSANVGAYSGLLADIGSVLVPGGDILLYGCAVGADALGAQFVGQLARATGADVAASTGLTGGSRLGGDWTLEYRTGAVSADGAFDAAAVTSLDTLLTPSLKDVTDTMNTGAGNFVPGFTLTTTSNVAGDPDAAVSGIYLDTGDNASFTVSADGTSVGVFDLTGMTFVKYAPASFTHYEITIVGHKAGGGTVTAKIDFATNSLTPTVPDDFTDMTGLTSFGVTIADVSAEQAGGAWDITLDAFTVDNVAAPAPATPDLTAGTDAGTSTTDNITSANAVAFTGTGASGASVSVFIDKNNNGVYDAGTDVNGTGSVSGGTWTVSGLSTLGLANGSYNVYAQQTVSGVASSLSAPLSITVDHTAPTLAITSSKSALKVGETSVITFTFSEDPGTTFDASDIAVAGGTLSALTTSGAVRTATFTPTASTDAGTASITVASGAYTDTAGNNGGAGTTPGLTFDTKAPTLTITSDKTALKAGETATITFTFSEDPGTSFVAGDVTVSGGALSGLTTTGAVRTATFTPTTNTNAGSASISVANNVYTDGGGNNGSGGSAPGITFDTRAPTVTISSSKAALNAGETATITFTFSEDPGASFSWDGTAGDVAVTGGTLGAISGSGTTRTATFTPDANTNAGSASITIASGTYADTAGNGGGAGTTPSITFDTKAPTVTVSSDKAAMGAGDTATITFTFSEDPGASFTWNGSTGDVTVSGGTLGAISGSGTTRTAVFTAGAGSSASISVGAGSYADAAGNTGAASNAFSISLDSTPPAAPSPPALAAGSDTGISSSDNLTKLATPTLEGTAEAGSTVKLYDGATLAGSGTADGAGKWSITTSALAAGSHSITAKATDAAGNTGVASAPLSFTVDTTAPALVIGTDTIALKGGETATITIIFTEDPGSTFTWDGTSGDLVVTGGTLGAISGSGNTRTATFTPDANTNAGMAHITVGPGSFADAAGNDNGASTTLSMGFDTKAPTVTIASDKASLKAGETATITFTFSEDPGASFAWDGSSGDVTVSGGTLGAISGSGTTRTAVFTPSANTNSGSASITIASGLYSDAAGNGGGAGTTPSITFDTLAPAAPSAPALDPSSDLGTSNSDGITSSSTPTLTGTAEAGATVTLYDGATLVGSGSADGSGNWSIVTSALSGGAHSITAKATDAMGNSGAASAALSFTVDKTAPTLAISSDKAALKGGETATITFAFSEDPGSTFTWDGTSGDVVVTGGTLGAISGSGNTRSATFTPDANTNAGTASITVASGSYTDAAGNNGGGGATPGVIFDTKAPTVTITSDKAALKAGETAAITFTFSEDPGASFAWDGSSGDVTVSGGTLGAISGSGTTRTAVFTPTASTNSGSASITISSAAYNDAAGNSGAAGTTPAISFDTLAPVAPSTPTLDPASDLGTSNSDGVTASSTPTLTGLAEAGATVKLYEGATEIGSGTVDGGGHWSIMTSALSAGAHAITAKASDAAGNTSAMSAALAVTIDSTAPTLAISSDKAALKVGETATITFTFSEDPGSTFAWDGTSGDVVVAGGTLGALSGSGNTRTATFTPDADTNAGTASITVASGTYTDVAGNNGGAGTTPGVTFDTKAPTVTITSDKAALKAGETAAITFTFTEDPGASFAWDGSSGDVTVSGGTLGAISGSGTTRTAVFTPSAGTNSGSASITIASGVYGDAAGNGGGAGAAPSITFDTLAPAAPSTPDMQPASDSGQSDSDNITASATPTFSGTAEAGATVKLYDGAALVGTGTATGGNWTITTSALASGAHAITSVATDAAGNAGPASAALPITVDLAGPTLAMTSSATAMKAGETATITFTFSEDPGASFTGGDITVTGGTLGTLSGTGTTRTALFTPAANATGTASISVAAASYGDLAGNAGALATAPAILFDTLAPTLTITSDRAALKAGETASITFTFSEDPGASFSAADVSVSGGTLGALSGSGTTRTAVFTPAAGVNSGAASITVASDSYTDAAGNQGGAAASPSLAFDTLAPSAPSAPDLSAASDSGVSGTDNTTGAASLTFTGTAEAGALVTVYDGTLAIGNATADGGGAWSVAATGLAEGPHAVTARATDAAGNTGGVSAALSVVVDRTGPALAISSDKAALKAGESATVTFTFSEDPGTSFDAADIQVSGGALGALSGTGSTRTAVFTPAAGGSGTASISVAGSAYADAAGNAGGADRTLALGFDTLAPTLSITSDKAALNAGQAATITFTFSEDPGASFSSADITITNGTLGPLTGSGTVRTALFTAATGVEGSAGISVGAATYADAAGNAGVAAAATLAIDTLAPAAPSAPDLAAASDLGLSDSDDLTSSATPLFTGTAENGATVRLYDGDALVGTGTASGGAWSITAAALADGAHALKAVATDAAGNSGPASAVLAVTVDTAAPTLAISTGKTALKTGETATITFTFSEDPGSSFAADDVTVSGGSIGALSGSGKVRTAVFTPAADTDASTATISVGAGKYTDAAGNPGAAGAAVPLAVDTKAPAALIAPRLAAASDSGASSTDGVTNATSLVFGGSAEEGALVTLVNAVSGAVLGSSAVTAGTWSVTVTGVAEGALSVAAFARDAAGNQGALSAATAVTVDRTAPAAPTVAAPELPRVHVGGLEDGATWEYSTDAGSQWKPGTGSGFVLTGDGSYSVVVRQLDLAGNASPGSTPLSVLLDTSAPLSQVALSDTSLTKGETATVTITFSEAVSGFDLGDISADNATLSQLDSSDGGRTWSALLTPVSGVLSNTNTVTVNNAGVRDLAGNPGVGTTSSPNYTVQTSGLGATISLSDTQLAAGETALVTITFSEPVRGFTLSDLSVENGKLSQLSSSDGRTWTALLTPSASVSDTSNHLVLDNTGVAGASGVRGEGTTVSANYTVETVRPTAAITIADHLLGPAASTMVTIRFSEAVTGFDVSDLATTVGTLSNLATADGGVTWTARLTADSGAKSAQPGFVSVDMGGLHNAAGNSGTGKVAVQFVQAPANAQLGTVDGVTVISQAVPDPVTGRVEQVVTVPEVASGRLEDPLTPNGSLADIPIGSPTGAVLTAGLPIGAGLQVAGPAAPLNGSDALVDLIHRIENTTTPGSATQSDMAGHGQDFLSTLGSGTLVESKTVVPLVAAGTTLSQPIVISGAAPGNPGAPVVGLVIDGSGLPAGSTLQLDNVEFAAVTGNVRLFGGSGRNYVVGDGASQVIYLGAEDDVLSGGAGNDFIGSAGGDDRLDGGNGDDLVAGGIGNDLVVGGSGNDVVLGGRSVAGEWQFYLSAGVLSARHGGAVFTASGSETVQGAELDASLPELRFLHADPQKVLDVALLYAALDRAPDLAGLSFWSQAGIGLKQVAAGMLASAEFDGGALGQTSDAVFVQGMYQHVLGRTPSNADVAFWTARLAGGSAAQATRADVLMAVALSEEHRKQVLGADGYLVGQGSQQREAAWFAGSGDDRLDGGAGNDVLVGGDGFDTALYAGGRAQYRVLLGADHSARVLDTTSGDTDTLSGVEAAQFNDGTLDLTFLNADLAQLGRVGMLYQAVLDRAADAAGLKWWLSLGMGSAQLVQAFTASPEFQARFGAMNDAAFVQELYANSGLDAGAAGGMQSWQAYLGQHTRAELVAAWIAQDDVLHAQFGTNGLWLV